MPESSNFPYDVFLSHSAKDPAGVRPLAERLRQDGLKVGCEEWELPRSGASAERRILFESERDAGRSRGRRFAEPPLRRKDRGMAEALPIRIAAFSL